VNAKSLLGLTTLGAGCGMLVDVIVSGRNTTRAMNLIRDLFSRGFDEGVFYEDGMAVEDEP
jgi:phosphotransferase system HPr-like phosphotransfer protein